MTEGEVMGVYDSFAIEYHLTPTGWYRGSEWEFSKKDKDIPPPADRVLTLMLTVRQASGWSKEDVNWSETWRCPSVTEDELEALKKRFPCPSRFADEITFS